MTMGEAVAKRIDQYLSERKITLYKLARNTCLPVSTLRNLYCGHTKSPTLALVFRIAEGLGVSPLEFLDCELFSPENIDLD